MAKTKISEFSATPANNTDIDSINIAEGCAPSGINDAIRELMSQLKDFQVGSAGDPVTVGGVLTVTAGAVGTPAITTAGDTNTGIFFPAADTIAFAEGGAEAMRIDSLGNLGVGVTPSGGGFSGLQTVQVKNYNLTGYANRGYLGSNTYFNSSGTAIYIASDYATRIDQGVSGAISFNLAAVGTAGNAITFTQAMTLDASGNLGVGTTSPSQRIHASKAGDTYIQVSRTSSGTEANLLLGCESGSNVIYSRDATTGNAPLLFFTGTSERARIASNGEFLVGTTSSWGGSPKMEVRQSGTAWGTSSYHTGTGGGSLLLRVDNTAVLFAGFYYTGSSLVGSITTNGSVTLYNTTSDYRLKNVIGAVTGHGNRIDALEPVEYTWKVDGSRTRGFLAHKFQEVYADSVTGTKDAVDADNKPIYQGMQAGSTEVIADLVAEIKSLRTRVAQLESN